VLYHYRLKEHLLIISISIGNRQLVMLLFPFLKLVVLDGSILLPMVTFHSKLVSRLPLSLVATAALIVLLKNVVFQAVLDLTVPLPLVLMVYHVVEGQLVLAQMAPALEKSLLSAPFHLIVPQGHVKLLLAVPLFAFIQMLLLAHLVERLAHVTLLDHVYHDLVLLLPTVLLRTVLLLHVLLVNVFTHQQVQELLVVQDYPVIAVLEPVHKLQLHFQLSELVAQLGLVLH
jgi:hypothetical protein